MVVHEFRSDDVTRLIGHLQVNDALSAACLKPVLGNIGSLAQPPSVTVRTSPESPSQESMETNTS